MKTLFLLAFFFTTYFSSAQLSHNTYLANLPQDTKIQLKHSFSIPSYQSTLTIDAGESNRCSCHYYTKSTAEERLIDKNIPLEVRHVSVKGIFDGSQRHVARIYLKNQAGYFKLKCYSRRMLIEHVLDYFIVIPNNPSLRAST